MQNVSAETTPKFLCFLPFYRWGNWSPEGGRNCQCHTATERELGSLAFYWYLHLISSSFVFREVESWAADLGTEARGLWLHTGLRPRRLAWPWASSPRATIFCLCDPRWLVTYPLSPSPCGNNWASCWPHGAAVGSNEITNVKVLCKLEIAGCSEGGYQAGASSLLLFYSMLIFL